MQFFKGSSRTKGQLLNYPLICGYRKKKQESTEKMMINLLSWISKLWLPNWGVVWKERQGGLDET